MKNFVSKVGLCLLTVSVLAGCTSISEKTDLNLTVRNVTHRPLIGPMTTVMIIDEPGKERITWGATSNGLVTTAINAAVPAIIGGIAGNIIAKNVQCTSNCGDLTNVAVAAANAQSTSRVRFQN